MQLGPEEFDYEGFDVFDVEGSRVGHISKIYVDDATRQAEWLAVELETDVGSTRSTLVPLIGATPAVDHVRVAYDRSTLFGAPESDAEAIHLYYGGAELGFAGGPPRDWP